MSASKPLFVFGTLRDEDVFVLVVGRPLAAFAPRPARLAGWRAVRVAAASYPVLVEAAGETAEGLVLTGLDADGMARLDAYEGAAYSRATAVIEADDGPLTAELYVAPSLTVTTEAWTLDAWRTGAKVRFLARLQERTEAAEADRLE